MAVALQSAGVGTLAYPFYTALFGDQKPVPGGDDATLLELDTGRQFAWKSGRWYIIREPGVSDLTHLLQAIQELRIEVVLLRHGMIEAGECKEVSRLDVEREAANF